MQEISLEEESKPFEEFKLQKTTLIGLIDTIEFEVQLPTLRKNQKTNPPSASAKQTLSPAINPSSPRKKANFGPQRKSNYSNYCSKNTAPISTS